MTEVVYRRYKRLVDENQPLPQLIIIDEKDNCQRH
jgi:excinuclease ABC subunit C